AGARGGDGDASRVQVAEGTDDRPAVARRERAERVLGCHRPERRDDDDIDGWQFAEMHRHRDSQSGPRGDLPADAGDIYADRRDRGIDGGSPGLRPRQGSAERGEPPGETHPTGQPPKKPDGHATKTVASTPRPQWSTT